MKHETFKANVLRDAEENAAEGKASQKALRKRSSLYVKHVEKHAHKPTPFNEVLMSHESQALPEKISEGGVDGDLYFSCRDDAIAGHVLVPRNNHSPGLVWSHRRTNAWRLENWEELCHPKAWELFLVQLTNRSRR